MSSIQIENLVHLASLVDGGSFFNKKRGRTGDTPTLDSFNSFHYSKQRWFCLMWSGHPDTWRLVYHVEDVIAKHSSDNGMSSVNFDNLSFGEYQKLMHVVEACSSRDRSIYLHDVSDVLLLASEKAHKSFRLYLRDGDVLELSEVRAESALRWVDAVYSAMQLQAVPEAALLHLLHLREEIFKHRSEAALRDKDSAMARAAKPRKPMMMVTR
jgi:hypothetical protein